jgi:cytochrome c
VSRCSLWLLVALCAVAGDALAQPPAGYGIGQPATPAEIAAWDIDVAPDGAGLPPGQGSVAQGGAIFAESCAACHGAHGEAGDGKPIPRLAGGAGTLAGPAPLKSVGSYWPYATTLFDYIRRAMPYNAPQSLSADQVYAVSAYVLYLNGIVAQDAVLDAARLAGVRMPNRDGFRPGCADAPPGRPGCP